MRLTVAGPMGSFGHRFDGRATGSSVLVEARRQGLLRSTSDQVELFHGQRPLQLDLRLARQGLADGDSVRVVATGGGV